MRSRSLYARLVSTYVASLFLGLTIFAVLAVFAIDRSLRNSVERRLVATAGGASAVIGIRDGRVTIDHDDRAQLVALLGVEIDGAVLDSDRTILFSTSSRPPTGIRGAAATTQPSFAALGYGQQSVQSFALPFVRKRVRLGTVVVWRADDWIEELDRDAALAFGVGALVISALAWLLGGKLTRRALDDAFSRQRRFTADASHELRAPLAVIRAESDLALRRERSAQAYRQSLNTIAGESDRLEQLVEDLLANARADSGLLTRATVDLDEVVRRTTRRLEPLAQANAVSIGTLADSQATITGDAAALERALLAVVHNAVKHAPRGSRVVVRGQRRDGRAEISVRDAGPGFSPAALEHAGERFWRDDRSRETAGSGLGLAIAQSIIEASGGILELSNAADGGAVVRAAFTLQ